MIVCGDALTELKKLDPGIVQTCITSPPYWGLRDYQVEGQIGLEPSPEAYVSILVEIFAEVKRVLRDDGTLWLVLGDSYAAGKCGRDDSGDNGRFGGPRITPSQRTAPTGLKPKDLCMIPARVALALQADGWWLRSDIIWHKPNPMPESVTDRPTSAHEHIFLLAKSARYYYDGDAVREPAQYGEQHANKATSWGMNRKHPNKSNVLDYAFIGDNHTCHKTDNGEYVRNKRNVWTVATQPYPEAHFAVYPPALIEPCVLAGSAEGDTVLDPFCGSGTTGEVAIKYGRKFIGIELNPEYVKLAEKRLKEIQGAMF